MVMAVPRTEDTILFFFHYLRLKQARTLNAASHVTIDNEVKEESCKLQKEG
jgi:hypothetical protein